MSGKPPRKEILKFGPEWVREDHFVGGEGGGLSEKS